MGEQVGELVGAALARHVATIARPSVLLRLFLVLAKIVIVVDLLLHIEGWLLHDHDEPVMVDLDAQVPPLGQVLFQQILFVKVHILAHLVEIGLHAPDLVRSIVGKLTVLTESVQDVISCRFKLINLVELLESGVIGEVWVGFEVFLQGEAVVLEPDAHPLRRTDHILHSHAMLARARLAEGVFAVVSWGIVRLVMPLVADENIFDEP